jgi:hypothetical protein
MIMPCWFATGFWLFGAASCFFYGLKAHDALEAGAPSDKWARRVHQFWFNFVGSVFGWGAAWFIAQKVALGTFPSHAWSDAALVALAFVGITGHLPYAVFGVLTGLNDIAKKLTKKVT